MMTVEFSLLITIAALVALAPVALQLRGLADRIAALRNDMSDADYTRELRFTIREVVVVRDPKVVALPMRRPRLAGSAPQRLRAIRLNEAA